MLYEIFCYGFYCILFIIAYCLFYVIILFLWNLIATLGIHWQVKESRYIKTQLKNYAPYHPTLVPIQISVATNSFSTRGTCTNSDIWYCLIDFTVWLAGFSLHFHEDHLMLFCLVTYGSGNVVNWLCKESQFGQRDKGKRRRVKRRGEIRRQQQWNPFVVSAAGSSCLEHPW